MITFFEGFGDQDFSSYTLLLPAVSVGNVGQLVTDLLITNLKPCKKIGRLFHPAIEPVVGNDVSEDGHVSLMTSCEKNESKVVLTVLCQRTENLEVIPLIYLFFLNEGNKLLLLQFRAPVLSKQTEEFVQYLTQWIKDQKFFQVICLSTTFASERIDSQLSGPPFRYVSSSTAPKATLTSISSHGWKPLEGRQFPAPSVIELSSLAKAETGETYVPGSGITKQLYDKCEALQVPITVLLMFVSEGDNTHDAKYFLSAVNHIFNWITGNGGDDFSVPPSWIHLFGSSFPQEIY